jgi:ribosomal protein S18 acetylase RimI-like enzyme
VRFDPRVVDRQLWPRNDDALARIEDAALNASQPPEQWLYDGWLLRCSPGKARRARSVQAVAAGRIELEEKIAHCAAFYRQRRLPLLFRITPFSQPAALDEALADAGLDAFDETRVMTLALDRLDTPARSGDDAAAIEPVAAERFAEELGRLRGSPATQVRAHAARLAAAADPGAAIRVLWCDQGQVLGAGQVILEGDAVGLYDVVTHEAARGRGIARRLSGHLLAQARAAGARTAYLQVDSGNEPARQVYRRLGFVDRYAYWYRWPSASSDELEAMEERA